MVKQTEFRTPLLPKSGNFERIGTYSEYLPKRVVTSYVFFNVFFHLPTDDTLSTVGRFFFVFLHMWGFFAGELHLSVFLSPTEK
jgi:hypothetical protein